MMSPLCRLLLLSASAFGPLPLSAAEPEQRQLFVAGEHGYALYRIPGIVVSAKGTLLAYAEARRTGRADWGEIDLVYRRSTDHGKTWSDQLPLTKLEENVPRNPVAVAQKLGEEGKTTLNNPVMIAARTGTLHLLFCAEYYRCFYQRSDDDGVTWTEPVDITSAYDALRSQYPFQVLATGPGHGIELANGRLVVPVWLSTGTGGHAHRPSVVATIISDDQGRSWKSGTIAIPNNATFVNPNETAAVELSDGRVMLNARSESAAHRRLVTVSPDGLSNWSTPRFEDSLLEPICFGTIVRVPGDKFPGTLVFANPDNLARAKGEARPGQGRDRVNVTLQVSRDDGQTWSSKKVLEPGSSGYSDLAAEADGTIWCLYERQVEIGGKSRFVITLARTSLSDW